MLKLLLLTSIVASAAAQSLNVGGDCSGPNNINKCTLAVTCMGDANQEDCADGLVCCGLPDLPGLGEPCTAALDVIGKCGLCPNETNVVVTCFAGFSCCPNSEETTTSPEETTTSPEETTTNPEPITGLGDACGDGGFCQIECCGDQWDQNATCSGDGAVCCVPGLGNVCSYKGKDGETVQGTCVHKDDCEGCKKKGRKGHRHHHNRRHREPHPHHGGHDKDDSGKLYCGNPALTCCPNV